MRFVVLSALCVICFGNSAAAKFKLKPLDVGNSQDPSDVKQIHIPSSRILQSKPTNTAVYAGDNATFYCSSQPGSGARIQWWEWTSSSTPQLISDQDLLTRHPNGNKYRIEQPNSYTYNLVIQDVQLSDVGTYTCLDSAFGPPCSNVSAEQAGNIASADLIVLTSAPECDTTISPSGSVLEDAYHTAECVMYFRGKVQPTITWTGPSPFTVFRQSTPTYAWSGIELNATRYMENLAFTAVSKFESSDPSSNFSDSTPMWNYTYQTPALNVSWGPKNLYVIPIKEFYHVGDVLRCYADAKPVATYVWQNMQNGDRFNTQTFTVSANMLDNTWTLRCQAMNNILGTIYSANVAVTVTVVTNPDTTAAEPQHSTEQTTEYLPTTGTQENNSSIGYPCETWFYNYEGEVVSFNYPWGYPPLHYYCNYYIYVYQSTPLTFTFNSPFEVGSNGYYGLVEIYSSNTGDWYSYSGSSPPAPIYFSYNYHSYIRISYYSQSPFPEVGFSLNYTREYGALTTDGPLDVTTARSISGTPCGTSFYDREGNITSENYPWGNSPYYPPHYSYCYYYIYVHQSTPITFTFTPPFGIRNSGGYYGYLEFYSTRNGLWYRVSGYSTPSPIYFGYDYYWEIQITYYSASPYQEEGFSLYYTFDSANADCGQTNFTDPAGFISSPNYPNNYPNNAMCNYSIQLDQISNISLEFLNPFWLESCCDWVKIYLDPNDCLGISNEIVHTYTGYTTPEPLTVDSCSALRVEFRSDSSATGAGFRLRYIAENTSILMMRNDYDGSNSYFFNRSWAGYKDEFGNLTSLYWIGLDRLHEVSQYGCRIRFDFQRQNGNWQFAEYSHFSVAGSSDNYRLSVGGYSGDFSDGMAYHNGQQFSTYDVDNDPYPGNCASDAGGGYWYNYCASSKITGSPYYNFWWADYLLFCEARMWC